MTCWLFCWCARISELEKLRCYPHMNTIIYSVDFEPITCIDLPIDVLESAERKGGLLLALKGTTDEDNIIQISTEKITWQDASTKTVLVTQQEEQALLLKPDWLVGQKVVVGAYQRTLKILTDKLKKSRPGD